MQHSAIASEILRRAAWPPTFVFLLHVAASRVLHAYERWPSLDIAMHLLGGIAIACFFANSLAVWAIHDETARLDPRLRALFVFALTCAAAVFWEFAEYLTDRLAGTTAQLGLADTLLDMLLGIVGGSAYLGFRARRPG